MGRSPKDIQDQITYPLTASLLGIPGVKSIRSSSMFGMSFIYIIFDDNIEFYWSRSRILEKLNSLPPGTLPEGVQPALGPDATALGQIYWYTLEGRDPATGKPTGGWNAEELRTLQDYYVKYSLSAAEGVSEVASAGGFVKEYQVELNPEAMRAFNVSVMDIMSAIKKSNLDIGAETMEINKVEYLIRGLGYIKKCLRSGKGRCDRSRRCAGTHIGYRVCEYRSGYPARRPGQRGGGSCRRCRYRPVWLQSSGSHQ